MVDSPEHLPESRPVEPAGTRDDRVFMEVALAEARAAYGRDEVPIGACLVVGDEIVARDHNRTREHGDPLAHAEMLVLASAIRERGWPRLPEESRLFCTVEPCFMCAGALVHARVDRVVFGVRDPKFGACASLGRVLTDPRANHRAALVEGVLADESRELMQSFFRSKR